jgi:hypothetical protein
MSLIERLRQLIGGEEATPHPAGATTPRDLAPPGDARGNVLQFLDSVRAALAAYTALSGNDQELEEQIRYRTARLEQAERMVEREAPGSPAGIRASELAGDATRRLSELAAWRKALVDSRSAARPAFEQASELLAQLDTYQDRARAINSHLPVEEAAAQAAVTFLDRPDADGRTGFDRLREFAVVLREQVARAEAHRPGNLA